MKNYKYTVYACFTGYIVQAIVNNFAPMLFVMFNTSYDIPLSRITLLITCNFLIQLLVDAGSILFIDRIGYRASCIIAHLFSAAGMICMALLPVSFNSLLFSVFLYATGGGLIEVLISPIMENCPSDNKEKAMSLLHSFYCWGHVGVVLFTTVFFSLFGISNWKYLTLIWAIIPLANMFVFAQVPISPMNTEKEESNLKSMFSNGLFWLFIVMMISSGASEQSVSQWASTLAEKTLGISKAYGDLFGPMMFALFMGTSRAVFGKYGDSLNLKNFFYGSVILCIVSYMLISIIHHPIINLAGCALAGLSVGIFWPGTISNASVLKSHGTALYALLALAGDVGCSLGPTVAGFVSNHFGGDLQTGILAATVFPVTLLITFYLYNRKKSDN